MLKHSALTRTSIWEGFDKKSIWEGMANYEYTPYSNLFGNRTLHQARTQPLELIRAHD